MKPKTESDLPVGRIAGLFGIRGELKCDPSNAGRALFQIGNTLRCSLRADDHFVTLSGVREHKGRLLVRFEGVHDANAALPFVEATLFASADDIELGDDEYLDRDLVGCDVLDEAGRLLGRVERVEHYPSSDMLVVRGRLVPLVRAFTRHISIDERRIVMELPPGILDDAEAEEA